MENEKCSKCNGTKRIMDRSGTIHPCWDCLMRGEADQHDKHPKDSGIKI